jgi:hypothetical protein
LDECFGTSQEAGKGHAVSKLQQIIPPVLNLYESSPLAVREEYTGFVDKLPRGIFERKREELSRTGDNALKISIICNLYQILVR